MRLSANIKLDFTRQPQFIGQFHSRVVTLSGRMRQTQNNQESHFIAAQIKLFLTKKIDDTLF